MASVSNEIVIGSLDDHILYFGYASNTSTDRIRNSAISTATFVSTGYIDDYKLSFYLANGKIGSWGGAMATLDNSEGSRIWGVIWKAKRDDITGLDKQESVPHDFNRFEKIITTENGEKFYCLLYMMNEEAKLPGKPSLKYIETLREGAKEHNFPKEYQEMLARVENI